MIIYVYIYIHTILYIYIYTYIKSSTILGPMATSSISTIDWHYDEPTQRSCSQVFVVFYTLLHVGYAIQYTTVGHFLASLPQWSSFSDHLAIPTWCSFSLGKPSLVAINSEVPSFEGAQFFPLGRETLKRWRTWLLCWVTRIYLGKLR